MSSIISFDIHMLKSKVRGLDLGVTFVTKTCSKTSDLHQSHSLLRYSSITLCISWRTVLEKSHKEIFNLNPLSSVANLQAFCSHLKSVIYGHQPLLLQKQGCASQVRATVKTAPVCDLMLNYKFLWVSWPSGFSRKFFRSFFLPLWKYKGPKVKDYTFLHPQFTTSPSKSPIPHEGIQMMKCYQTLSIPYVKPLTCIFAECMYQSSNKFLELLCVNLSKDFASSLLVRKTWITANVCLRNCR